MRPEMGRSLAQSSLPLSGNPGLRDRHIDILKTASAFVEKSQGFTSGIQDILALLSMKSDLLDSKVKFFNSATRGSSEIRYKATEGGHGGDLSLQASAFSDESVNEAVRSAESFVESQWRYKMVPVTTDGTINLRSCFKIQRGVKLYVLSLPIKLGEQKIGIMTAVKLCYGSFNPKAELDFLAVLCLIIAQSAMINRFYPENKQIETQENTLLKPYDGVFDKSGVIGNSKAMQRVFSLLEQVSAADTPVMITGESGVGKELIAQAIHKNSHRSQKPFVKVNCAAYEGDHEQELFGVEPKEDDSSCKRRIGKLEQAEGGTIFLDEISELPMSVQIKLLRFLQDQEYQTVGSSEICKGNVRVIVATDHRLQTLVEKQEFRQDLYYRLNVFPIHVPALRERKTDIIPITDFFVEKYRRIHHKNIRRISTPAIDLLSSYHWPGNIRELENCIERAVILSDEGVIRGHHLPPSLQMSDEKTRSVEGGGHLQTILDSMEKELILDAIKESRGNMAKAARELGLTERVMGLRTRKYNIESKKYRKQLH